MRSPGTKRMLITSVAVTIFAHCLVVGFVVAADRVELFDCEATEALAFTDRCKPPEEDDRFKDAETIEASLAFKEVKPKNNQPVKIKKKKFAPPEKGVSRDPDAKPPEKKNRPNHKVDVTPDEVDIQSILEKNRQQDPDLSSTGVDEKPKEGSASGSEWGTEREAKGDPYAGELRGRIESVLDLPALERGGGIALGCVRLNKDGKIIDSKLKKRSKNSNLNRSVTLALKKAPPMEKPVPAKMLELLTVRGICFRFKLDEE